MPKPRSSSGKRDREFRKRERDKMKREKAASKRQRRDDNKGAAKPLTPDVVRGTEADAQPSDDQGSSSPLSEDSESESEADVGTESCTG